VFGGLGPGLLATALSAALTITLYRAGSLVQNRQFCGFREPVRFIIGSVLVTLLMDALYKARRRGEEQQQLAAVILSSIRRRGSGANADGALRSSIQLRRRLLVGQPRTQSIKVSTRYFAYSTRLLVKLFENRITRVIREGAIVGLANHTVLETRGGLRIPIDDSGAPVKDERGRLKGAFWFFETLRKAQGRARASTGAGRGSQSQQQISGILAGISDGFVALDRDWKYINVNEEAAQQQRNNATAMIGKSSGISFALVGTHFQTELQRAVADQIPGSSGIADPETGRVSASAQIRHLTEFRSIA